MEIYGIFIIMGNAGFIYIYIYISSTVVQHGAPVVPFYTLASFIQAQESKG